MCGHPTRFHPAVCGTLETSALTHGVARPLVQFAVPSEEYIVDPIRAKALDLFIILHMDHEQNASTSTVRTAGGPRHVTLLRQ